MAVVDRRRALDRIGLPEVRSYRLAALVREQESWQAELRQRSAVVAELNPLLILRLVEVRP